MLKPFELLGGGDIDPVVMVDRKWKAAFDNNTRF